jgi:hypothetical protein
LPFGPWPGNPERRRRVRCVEQLRRYEASTGLSVTLRSLDEMSPRSQESQVKPVDLVVSNSTSLFGLFENPVAAYTTYWEDEDVKASLRRSMLGR